MLNALYGQLSNRFCRWFDIRIPRSITCTGQTMIRYIARRINELVNEECGTKDEDYILTIDTDSVVGDTIIKVDGKDITIKEYYDKLNTKYLVNDDFNQNYVKKGEGKTLSVNNNLELEENNITYVMKHKVKKKMYKLKVKDKEVIVTCDHSLIVYRDNKLLTIKPNELLKSDKIVMLNK